MADRGPADGLRLITDNGLFLEFVPLSELETEQPSRHWAANLEIGINYAVAVTSCAGLWSYVLGDTVRFLNVRPPHLIITGRISYALSSFGEHLTGEEIESAVTGAAAAIGALLSDFSVGTIYPADARARGGHLYIVEFTSPLASAKDAQKFIETVDQELCRRNDDYSVHRSGGFGMDQPKLMVVQRGTFEAWMKSRGRLGGQNKVPRVISDQDLFDVAAPFLWRSCRCIRLILHRNFQRFQIGDQVVDFVGCQHELRHLARTVMGNDDSLCESFGQSRNIIFQVQCAKRRRWLIRTAPLAPHRVAGRTIFLRKSMTAHHIPGLLSHHSLGEGQNANGPNY